MNKQIVGTLTVEGGDASHATSPEKALWVAVFEQAINDIRVLTRRARANPSVWDNPLFRNDVNALKHWFRDRSMEPGGFGFLCELLEIDPEHAAKRIKQRYLQHLTPVTDRLHAL